MPQAASRNKRSQHGFAIIMVVFVVALATILVINLTYSQSLGSRLNAMTVQGFQAEYVLKSALNFARRLLETPPDPEGVVPDPWKAFQNGAAIPGELLGIGEQNVLIELQIRPLDATVWIQQLGLNSSTIKWAEVAFNLFTQLGFDDDGESDQSGPFKGKVLKPDEMVGALIDYTDPDKESYAPSAFARGIENEVPEDLFPNERLSSLEELKSVPGFTPRRLEKLTPLVRVEGQQATININYAPREVLKALHSDMDDQLVDRIIQERKARPFTRADNWGARFRDLVGQEIYNQISSMITVESSRYQVLAKVDFGGNARYFIRAVVSKGGSGPEASYRVFSIEFF